MARVAVIGEPLRIYGYGLAGAVLCPVSDPGAGGAGLAATCPTTSPSPC